MYSVYQKLYFNSLTWKKIINKASNQNNDIWFDIFDVYGVEILKNNLNKIFGIKLQSSLYNNELLSSLKKINLKIKNRY